MTLYETLEVKPDASQREIKRAYRRLALRYHPDRNPGDAEAEEHFKEVVAAYMVLSDRDKRAEYDARFRPGVRVEEPYTAPGEWRPPPPRREEWPDIERDLRGAVWRSAYAFDFRDAHLGGVLAVALTIAANATDRTAEFLFFVASTFATGYLCSWPLRRLLSSGYWTLRTLGAVGAPLVGGLAAIGASVAVVGQDPDIFGASGLPYAFLGGTAGALVGGCFGRALRFGSSMASGLLAGGFSGALAGAFFGFFFWYWGTIFRWMEWPARDDLSLLAFAGVVGSFLGAAIAAALGSLRLADR